MCTNNTANYAMIVWLYHDSMYNIIICNSILMKWNNAFSEQ